MSNRLHVDFGLACSPPSKSTFCVRPQEQLCSGPPHLSTVSAYCQPNIFERGPDSNRRPKSLPTELPRSKLVEVTGIEPATYCLQSSRSPN